MIITHHGAQFFKVSFGDTTLAFNPISKDSRIKPTRFGADIALVSLEHPDMNGVDQVAMGDRVPIEVRGPGEYEIRDVLIKGFPSKSMYGGEERINTIYLVTLEKMTLLFLGALSETDLPQGLKETLDSINILFLPIGGEGVLDPAPAHKLAVSIGPNVIIPMHYGDVGRNDALELFLKEEGKEPQQPTAKFTVKQKDLTEKQNEIVLFEH